MKRRFLMGIITAGLMLSMVTSAFATTQVNTTFNFESSFTQEGSTKGTIQDMLNSITSNPTVPKLNVKLDKALSTYVVLINDYNTAKTEGRRKTILGELTQLISAIHEVIPDLTFTEYDTITGKNTTTNSSLDNILEFFVLESVQLASNKMLAPYFINGEIVKPEHKISTDEAQTYIEKLNNLKTLYVNANDNQKEKIISTLEGFKTALNGFENNESVLATINNVFSGLDIEIPKEGLNVTVVKSFSDVPTSHWGHKDIMAMTNKGLFSGTGKITNGVGTFAPAKTMSRAEFVTVVMRALYNDELSKMSNSGGQWWENSYDLAVEKGILKSNELDNGAMDKGMSRQEMALVLVRATEQLGQSPSQLVSTGKIADYNTIGTYYKDYVVKAYSMGMLAGTDSKGTYAPQATMNRAQGAVTLNRLVDSASRIKVDFNEVVVPPVVKGEYLDISQTIARATTTLNYSDANRYEAKVGDKIIINGVTHDVVAHPSGAVDVHGMKVPYVKGVALDLGINTEFGKITSGFRDGGIHNDEQYTVNKYTNEGYWTSQWAALYTKCPQPTKDGTKDDQLSADNLWVWDAVAGMWVMTAGDC